MIGLPKTRRRLFPAWVGTLAGAIFFGFGGVFMLLMPGTLTKSNTVAAVVAIAFGAIGFPWAWHEYKADRERRNRPARACQRCNYDLQGLPNEVCPECGHDNAIRYFEH